MDFDIRETLNGMAENEYENFKAFNERLVEFCTKEKALLTLFRVLKGIKDELKDCLKGKIQVNADRSIIKKVLKTVKTELFIIKAKVKNPKLVEFSEPVVEIETPQPAGEWKGDKLNLIELIYAIWKTNKNFHLNKIQKCFEYIFHVQLGNISNRISEMDIRKEQDNLYLDVLLRSLKNFLDEMNL